MSRVIATVVCGLTLSACSSVSWMPSMDWVGGGGNPAGSATLTIETDPPGADARAATGAVCKTPCTLSVNANGDFTVNVALNGYLPQTVPVRVIPPVDIRIGGDSTPQLDPNPLYVALEKAPPPPPPPKKKPPKKRTPPPASAAKPVAPTAAAPAPAPAAAPMTPPAQSANAPWPMPR